MKKHNGIQNNGCCCSSYFASGISEKLSLENVPVGVARLKLDENITILDANNMYYDLMNLQRDRLICGMYDYFPATWKKVCEDIQRQRFAAHPFHVTWGGQQRWLCSNIQQIDIQDGCAVVTAAFIDSTCQHQIMENLELEIERYKIAMSDNRDVLFEYDITKDIMDFFEISNASLVSNVKQRTIKRYSQVIADMKIIHPDDLNKIHTILHDMEIGMQEIRMKFPADTAYPHKDEYIWTCVRGRRIYNADHKAIKIIGTIRDIHDSKRNEQKLLERTQKEPLSNLYNRETIIRLINHYLYAEDTQQTDYALLIIDIDNFKYLNDNYGHLYGDMIISNVSKVLYDLLGSDVWAGRIGGDEFLVFLKNTDRDAALATAKQICHVISDIRVGNMNQLSCSIGISTNQSYPFNQQAIYEELFMCADKALYYIKSTGKNNYIIYDDISTEPGMKIDIANDKFLEKKADGNIDIIDAAFQVLDKTKNIRYAVTTLLQQIAIYFSFDNIEILRFSSNQSHINVEYSWHRYSVTEKMGVAELAFHEELWQEIWKDRLNGGVTRLTANHAAKLTDEMQIPVCKLLNFSTYFTYMPVVNDDVYMLLFQDIDKQREITVNEEEIITELSKIISAYISKQKQIQETEQKLETMRNFDELTGLVTLNKFKEMATEFILNNPGQKWVIIYSDFCRFKYLNEIYGYESGNAVLKDFADFLPFSEDSGRKIVTRITGDAFMSFSSADSLGEDICTHVIRMNNDFCRRESRKYPLVNIAIRSGIYILDENENIISAIDRANIARKEIGDVSSSKCLLFNEEMNKRIMEEAEVTRSMNDALHTNQFLMYLQPKVNLKSGVIVGAEALARWKKPDGTMIEPQVFIPYFEKNGFVTTFDFYIYEKALQQICLWQREGLEPVGISVNFSRLHAGDEHFVNKTVQLAEQYNISPELIEFELTETILATCNENILQNVRDMMDYGFKVAIDDFGSGYSSLNLLAEMVADDIKIDKALLHESLVSKRKAHIIRHAVEMAHEIDYHVVCEGVETEEEVEFLKSIHCEDGQGYYFSAPVPCEQFTRMLIDQPFTTIKDDAEA